MKLGIVVVLLTSTSVCAFAMERDKEAEKNLDGVQSRWSQGFAKGGIWGGASAVIDKAIGPAIDAMDDDVKGAGGGSGSSSSGDPGSQHDDGDEERKEEDSSNIWGSWGSSGSQKNNSGSEASAGQDDDAGTASSHEGQDSFSAPETQSDDVPATTYDSSSAAPDNGNWDGSSW